MLDAKLIPVIQNLKAQFEKNKLTLVGFFPKNVIDKACYDYAQQELKKHPFILSPTKEGVAFYRPLADLNQLKAIIFEQEKLRFSRDLHSMVGDKLEQAKTCLARFRLSRLKNGYQPGVFSEHLRSNRLIQETTPPKAHTTKKARFA